jgi:membrane-bound inhibitor of C-type lysozyme
MRGMRPRLVGVALLFALTGCQREAPSGNGTPGAVRARPTERITMAYVCDSGVSFVATVRRDTAWAFLPSGTVSLPHVESASGARYSDGRTTLWMKGEEATLETPAGTVQGCVNDRARAAWEHAKLGGADFRAVGNEPGWSLTIVHDSIVLVTDYGETRHTLEVVIEAGGCRDSMSGDAFETTVTLTLDGRALRGCGRALH